MGPSGICLHVVRVFVELVIFGMGPWGIYSLFDLALCLAAKKIWESKGVKLLESCFS